MKSLLFICFFTNIFFWTAISAQAQSGFTVTPAFQEIVLDQDTREKEFFVDVVNGTGDVMTTRLSVLDFNGLDESGGVAFLGATGDLERKYALASWMRPEKDVVTLLPGEKQSMRITIENRESLSPGGHYGALVFKTEDPSRTDNSGNVIAVNQMFSVLVFVKKVGGEIYELTLKGHEQPMNLFRLPEKVRLRFHNSGNVHMAPRGRITITDPLGRDVAKGIINEESGIILPETLRTYTASLKMVERSFVPGRYTMTIAYRYDGQDAFDTVVTRLGFFLPLPVLAGVIVVIGGIVGWYSFRRQRSKTTRETP